MTKDRWWFGVIEFYNVPKINKKSELIDINQKIPLLRNMRPHSLRSQGAKLRGHVSKKYDLSEFGTNGFLFYVCYYLVNKA